MVSGPARDAVVEKGMELFRLVAAQPPALFDRRWWAGRLMASVLAQPDWKARLFRFIDAFPELHTPEALAGHVRDHFLSGESPFPWAVRNVISAAAHPATAALAGPAIRRGIARMGRNFIAGETVRESLPVLRKIWDEGRTFTVDILGEAAVSEPEASHFSELTLSLIETLAGETVTWGPGHPEREGRFPRVNVSVKPSSLYSRIGPANYDDSVAHLAEAFRPIFRKARETGAFVNLDMETRTLKDVTLDAFRALRDEPEFRDWNGAGVAVQAYLRETPGDLARLVGWARLARRRITVRLVKGAYWEHETITARQKGWPIPVFSDKTHTDWQFERCVETILDNGDFLMLAAGTHNIRSIAAVIVAAERRGIPPGHYEFQMLYGMAEPVKRALARMGHPVREYVPIGALVPGMAYLVRRLLENSSNEGFLRKAFAEKASPERLLAEPDGPKEDASASPPTSPTSSSQAADRSLFRNEPPLDLSLPANREMVRAAIETIRGRLGREYPAVIDGKPCATEDRIVSRNPARPGEAVGIASAIDKIIAERALAVAHKAQRDWARTKPEKRAEVLFRAAEIARRRRAELLAWQIFEVGKSWTEADADVAEAVDYLEYYGREMIRLGAPRMMGNVPGEENVYRYRPRGVGLVVAPWNFPLAISMGMVSAALAAGNAVLSKPSSLSPVNGWLACSILLEAGVPEGVLHFIPGRGEAVGDYLVTHPGTDFILFTGSKEVGLGMIEKAGRTGPGQRGVKRVVAEMGGKNAVIVDADADLDQAVPAVLHSAFSYQGQKCSACSRVIVHAACHTRFLTRLSEAVRGIPVGPPEDPAHFMGPVIDARAKERIFEYVALGRKEGRVAAEAPIPDDGHYVSPIVLADLPPDSRILREEIFGPVLAVIRAKDLEEAIRIANGTEFALTGGLFSRSPSAIARVRDAFDVGNLYINRAITGALVGRQPFGGFRMSGVGSKAGGPDYLLQLMEPQSICENTVRRGFSPDVIS